MRTIVEWQLTKKCPFVHCCAYITLQPSGPNSLPWIMNHQSQTKIQVSYTLLHIFLNCKQQLDMSHLQQSMHNQYPFHHFYLLNFTVSNFDKHSMYTMSFNVYNNAGLDVVVVTVPIGFFFPVSMSLRSQLSHRLQVGQWGNSMTQKLVKHLNIGACPILKIAVM